MTLDVLKWVINHQMNVYEYLHRVPLRGQGSQGNFPGHGPQQGPGKAQLMLDNHDQDARWKLCCERF